jgi:hypothetical protein
MTPNVVHYLNWKDKRRSYCIAKVKTKEQKKARLQGRFDKQQEDEVLVINVSFPEGIGFRFWGNLVGILSVSFALTVSQTITVNENDPILQKKNAHAIPIQSLHSWYNLFEWQQCYCWRN